MSSHLSNSRRSPCECKVVTLGKRLLLSHTPSKPQLGSHAQPLLARHPILPRKQGGKPAPSPRTPSGDSDSCRGIVQMSGASHPSVCLDSSPYRVKTCRPRVRLPFPPGCLGLCRGPQPLALSPVFSDLGAFPNQDATPGMSRRGDEEGESASCRSSGRIRRERRPRRALTRSCTRPLSAEWAPESGWAAGNTGEAPALLQLIPSFEGGTGDKQKVGKELKIKRVTPHGEGPNAGVSTNPRQVPPLLSPQRQRTLPIGSLATPR